MATNDVLESIIDSGNSQYQTRVLRYDVDFAKSFGALDYESIVMASNPAYYYKMESGSVSRNRGFVQGFDASYQNGPTFGDGTVDPCDQYAYLTNGSYAIVNNPNIAPTTGNDIAYTATIEGWFNRQDNDTDTPNIIAKDNDGSRTEFSLYINSDGYLELYSQNNLYAGNNYRYITHPGIAQNGKWNHFAIVTDPTNTTLYLNGVPAVASNPFTLRQGSNSLTIGTARNVATVYNNWEGYEDEIAIYRQALTSGVINQHYRVGIGAFYPEPDEDIETDSFYTVPANTSYADVVKSNSPAFWMRCDDLNGSSTFTEKAKNISGTYSGATADRIRPTAIFNDAGYARRFSNAGWAVVNNLPILGSSGDLTVEFWYRHTDTSTEIDAVLGYNNPGDKGFAISVTQEQLSFYRYDATNRKDKLTAPKKSKNTWYHYVFTVSKTGKMKCYINGTLVASRDSSNLKGYIDTVGTFQVGKLSQFQDVPGFDIDELSMYPTELSAETINRHYSTGKYGEAATTTVIGSGGTGGSPYVLSCSDTSHLYNELDITDYVQDFEFTISADQLIDTGSLSIREGWGFENMAKALPANTYVKIQERFFNGQTGQDTGWLDLHHFLVDGPASKTVEEQGKAYGVSLKGIMKLSSLDIGHMPIEPDKLFVSKTLLTNTSTTIDRLKFQCPRPGTTTYYQNWAEFPSVRLWVSGFQNYNSSDANDVDGPNDMLRIKGAEGAIQVLAGEGSIVIDRQFFEDKLTETGLGNPSKVYAEFYRYADRNDIALTQVANIAHDGNWYLQLTDNVPDADGKTIIVKSGLAKGKLFKTYTVTGAQSPYQDFQAGSNVDRGAALAWTNPGYALSDDSSYAEAGIGGSTSNPSPLYSNLLRLMNPTGTIPSYATIQGIELMIRRKATDHYTNLTRTGFAVTDDIVQLIKGGSAVAQNKANVNAVWEMGTDITKVYGGPNDLWGTTWAPADINSSFGAQLGIKIVHPTNANGIWGAVDEMAIRVYYGVGNRLYVRDFYGNVVSPKEKGLAIGDSIQIGDANNLEDAIRKQLLKSGYQEHDGTAPFYFDIVSASVEINLPPLRPKISDNQRQSEILTAILEYAPPNYALYTDRTGAIRTANVIQKDVADAHLKANLDYSEDRTDFGNYTRVVALGEGGESVNVALNIDFGGTAVSRAYKLDQFALQGTLQQTVADTYIQKIFDTTPKTPKPTSTDDLYKKAYGLLYEQKGKSIKKWAFQDEDLFCVDLGLGPINSKQYEIDYLQFTSFNSYPKGNVINQSFYVYYMTQEDYIAEFGVTPPDRPTQAQATGTNSYIPPSTAKSWKLLLDEFNLDDGQTNLESSSFATNEPTRMRFLKVRVGQSSYRFNIPGEDDNKYARLVLSDMKVWTSRRIVATAELGVTAPYNTGDYKLLANTLRRRTYLLDKNQYVDTFTKGKQFSLQELRERYTEFYPVSVNTWHPNIRPGMTVDFIDPETGATRIYLVREISRSRNGLTKGKIIDYRTGS